MLVNSQGKAVKVHPKAKGDQLAEFREVLEPIRRGCGNMFNMEQRARVKGGV